jgi:hypothetical protein
MPTADRPGAWQLVCPVFRHERARPFRAAAPRWLPVAGLRSPSRDEWLASTEAARTATGWTVERWLRHWLDNRTKIRPTTRFHYTRNVEQVLIPHLGNYRLRQLDARLLRTVFAQIATTTNSKGQEQSPSAMQHLRTTLRSGGDRAGLADLRRGPALRPIAGHRHPRCDLTPGCATGGLQGPSRCRLESTPPDPARVASVDFPLPLSR